MAALAHARHAYGLARSLWMYYGKPGQGRRLRAFYAELVRPGDLCFDIGAHVGNRTRCFRALGARVVAVEPQPRLAAFLRRILNGDPGVTLVEEAIGAAPGELELLVSARTPTVSTGSRAFLDAVGKVPSFAWVAWDERVRVPVTTLDALIARFGVPAFVKVDVEGMEAEVLAGLSRPVPALSFEVIPAFKENALACLDRLAALGRWRFNVSIGERQSWLFAPWVGADAIRGWLDRLAPEADSGDVYARLDAPS
jgi:FkbM family methyltransferase